MGRSFIPANATNPLGHWEDKTFHDLNVARLSGALSAETWQRCVDRVARRRVEPWGVKDPRIADLLPEYLGLFPGATVLRCRRPRHDVVTSMCRAYGWSEAHARQIVDRRESALDHHVPWATDIRFDVLEETLDAAIACAA